MQVSGLKRWSFVTVPLRLVIPLTLKQQR